MDKKFYRTIVAIEILSEDPIGDPNVSEIDNEIFGGDWSGESKVILSEEVSEERMAKFLIAQGSDPEFFGIEGYEEAEDDGEE
jgi:hypothetical protein